MSTFLLYISTDITINKESLNEILAAIKSLKEQESYLNVYILPFISTFASFALALFVAYISFHYQEFIKNKRGQINIINTWSLFTEEARSNLIAIKFLYHGQLTDDPIQRLIKIPPLISSKARRIIANCADIAFLVPRNSSEERDRWSSIILIRNTLDNYNYLLGLWEERTKLAEKTVDSVVNKRFGKAHAQVDINDFIQAIGEAELVKLIDLTERIIRFTDDMIIELSDLLYHFPEYAKRRVDIKKQYGTVLTFPKDGNEQVLKMMSKSPPADYSTVSYLFGKSVEEMISRYNDIKTK
jgi:hypothetical protein